MILKDLTKEEQIRAEVERINSLFECADANKRALVEPLIENVAFMKITLEEMQQIINRDGVTDHYTNGRNQEGEKSSAAVQGYNGLVKNYANIIKTLIGIVPSEQRKVTFMRFQGSTEPTETEEEKRARINDEIARAAAWQAEQREKAKTGN